MAPRRKDADEEDETPEVIPVEPSGKDLTLKRHRQEQGRRAAEALWSTILSNLQKAERDARNQ